MPATKSAIQSANNSAHKADRLTRDAPGADVVTQMQRHPYFGFVDVTLPGNAQPSFAMLTLNDCAIAGDIFWRGGNYFEEGSIAIWRRLSTCSRKVIDAGAYTGLYSLVTASVNGGAEIHAFEPVPFIFARLEKNAILNGFAKITAHQMALSNVKDRIAINIPFGAKLFSSGSSLMGEGSATGLRIDVDVARLDDLDLGPVDLIKMDTEGAEALVLDGMARSLDAKPTLLIEVTVAQQGSIDALRAQMPDGYRHSYIQETGGKVLIDDFAQWCGQGGRNVLFWHPERAEHYDIISSLDG